MTLNSFVRHARRVVIFVVGGTVLLLGVIMVIGPGPGLVTVAAGLGILAIEFAWAKRWLDKARDVAGQQTDRFAPAWVKRLMDRVKGFASRQAARGECETRVAHGSCEGGTKAGEDTKKEEGKQ